MEPSPTLAATGTYPFVKLEEAKRRLAAQGVELIDFGKGDPREPTDPLIRRALVASLAEISTYPLAEGLPELRAAVAAWCALRFGVELDPDSEVVPTYGSKEAIFLLAQIVVDRDSEKRLVVTTQPGYPVPDRGALFAGAEVEQLPLLEDNGFLVDLDAIPEEMWERAAIVWLNYPNNPTGAVAPLEVRRRVERRGARRAHAGCVPAQARSAPADTGAQRRACRRRRRDDVPLARGPQRRVVRGARGASARARPDRLARDVLRPRRRGLLA